MAFSRAIVEFAVQTSEGFQFTASRLAPSDATCAIISYTLVGVVNADPDIFHYLCDAMSLICKPCVGDRLQTSPLARLKPRHKILEDWFLIDGLHVCLFDLSDSDNWIIAAICDCIR